MRLIFLGAPGAGKGTQGALLAKRHGLARIATGELLRAAVRKGTALGREARQYMDAGELVPDDVILGMVREVISDARDGFVLDGFPRTIEQANGLDALLEEMGMPLDAVIVLEVPDDVLVKRISGRRTCPECHAVYNVYLEPPEVPGTCDRCGSELSQRGDDDAATVQRRLAVYRRQTEPLIAHYQQAGVRVEIVDGQQGVEAVQRDIHAVLAPA